MLTTHDSWQAREFYTARKPNLRNLLLAKIVAVKIVKVEAKIVAAKIIDVKIVEAKIVKMLKTCHLERRQRAPSTLA